MNSTLCNACPRHCNALRPAGFCKSPAEPVLARAALHHWEEPVISGTKGSGAIFFSGCNLQCVFCQNYGISTEHQGTKISVERLRTICDELIAQGAHNINFVTPGHYTDAILQCLEKPLPVPTVYNTNGYDSVETLRKFENKIQIYLPDMKYMDNTLAKKYSAAPDYAETAKAAILEMFRQTGPYRINEEGLLESGVVIRHLILPNAVQNSLDVIRWVSETFRDGDVLFSLMRQYYPCGKVSDTDYPELNRVVTDEEYEIVENALFESGMEDGFVQDGESADSKYTPDFDGTGVL
ncbi:MAG: radical SAM protein [Lentisphaeria bacterium]|nr:radical SAM protein [Lentisphaeria bacterium]